MAEAAKDAAKKAEPKLAPPARVLARASECGDPAVQQVMAELQTARLNDDAERVSALVEQLADLGYE